MKYHSNLFVAFVYLLCMFALISDYKVLSNLIGSITTVITLLYIISIPKKRNGLLERRANVYLFLFIAYFILSSFIHFNPNKWGVTIMVYIMVFTPYFLYSHLYRTKDYKFSRYLVNGFFVIWTIFLVLCFWTCYEIPDLARTMVSERSSYYTIINGGGYYMGYGSAILTPYLLNGLLNGKIKTGWRHLFVIFEIILMIATVLVINSYVTLIALVAGIAIVAINRIAKTSNIKMASYFAITILVLVLYYNAAPILNYLIKNTSNDFWNSRLVETYDAVVSNDTSFHVNERERVYEISWKGFLESPIFGNGYKNGNAFEGEGANNIGNHSTILDSLSQFGIIGALPLFLFLLYPWRRARARGEDWEYMIPFILMAYMNPLLKTFHVMVIIFLIIPCIELLHTTSRDQQIKAY